MADEPKVMTRDEQVDALYAWWSAVPGVGHFQGAIVDHFPAFMAKCAEIGLCHQLGGGDGPWTHAIGAVVAGSTRGPAYAVPEPQPPHEHEWRVVAALPTAPEWYCRCGERRPIPVPSS